MLEDKPWVLLLVPHATEGNNTPHEDHLGRLRDTIQCNGIKMKAVRTERCEEPTKEGRTAGRKAAGWKDDEGCICMNGTFTSSFYFRFIHVWILRGRVQ